MRPLPGLRIFVNPLTGCWEWVGQRDDNGYGVVYSDGRTQSAHRAVWALLVGPIGDGMQLDHLCRLRACVNPTHLEEVTGTENLQRMHAAQGRRAAATARRPRPPRAIPAPTDARALTDVLGAMAGRPAMHTADILAALDPVTYATPEQLAAALAPHGLRATVIKLNRVNRRGHRAEALEAALARWNRRNAG